MPDFSAITELVTMKLYFIHLYGIFAAVLTATVACGTLSGSAATEECLRLLVIEGATTYSMEGTQLSEVVTRTSVSGLTDDERTELYRWLNEVPYEEVAQSEECGSFIDSVEAWEETEDGASWVTENGEWLAGLIFDSEIFEGALPKERLCSPIMHRLYPLAGVSLENSLTRSLDTTSEQIGESRYRVTSTKKTKQVWTDGAHGRVEFEYECVYAGEVNPGTREANVEVQSGKLWVNDLNVGIYEK